jgi:hypothetical protein
LLNLDQHLTVLKKFFAVLPLSLTLSATPPLKAQVTLGSQIE